MSTTTAFTNLIQDYIRKYTGTLSDDELSELNCLLTCEIKVFDILVKATQELYKSDNEEVIFPLTDIPMIVTLVSELFFIPAVINSQYNNPESFIMIVRTLIDTLAGDGNDKTTINKMVSSCIDLARYEAPALKCGMTQSMMLAFED